MNPTTLQMLLARLANERNAPLPDPAAPMSLGPLSNDTALAFAAQNPEPVPPRFVQPAPVDMGFVNQESGARPTPPAPPSTLARIMNAIGGFGAGVQGQGAQFLDQLREPQREYQRQVERYQGRRTQGIELAERRAEREADRANRANEMLYESEYKKWLSKNSDRSAEAKQRMAQALVLERDARRARLEADREVQRERRQQERDAIHISDQFWAVTKKKTLSDEIGRYKAGLSTTLSPAAAALEHRVSQLGEARMDRAMRVGGGGGTGGGVSRQTAKLVEEFNTVRQNLITATARGDAKGQKQHRMRLDQLVRRLSGRPGVEAGYGAGQWPYVKVNGVLSAGEEQPTAQPQAQAKTITRAEMQTLGVTEAQVKAEGYTITP